MSVVRADPQLPNRTGLRLTGQRVSLVHMAHGALQEAIISLHFEPGEAVTEERLAGELGVSRAILREALQRLQADGLLAREGNGRLRVADVSCEDAHALYAVRSAIEQAAVVEAMGKLDSAHVRLMDASLQQLRKVTAGGDAEEIALAGGRLHDLIAEIAANPVIHQVRSLLKPRLDRYRRLGASVARRSKDRLRESEEIVEAFRGHDAEAARAAMARHIAAAEATAIAAFNALSDSKLS